MVYSKKVTITLDKKDDIINLEPLGDIHIGHSGFDEKLYTRRVNAIANDPNRYSLFMGDQIDAITIYDKRYNPDMAKEHDIAVQTDLWNSLTEPLLSKHRRTTKNEKVWGLLHGNHEYKIPSITKAFIEMTFTRPHNISFLGSRALIGLEVKYKEQILGQWGILAIHGSGGGKPETMFEQMKKNHYMDIFICGHLHQKRYTPQIAIDFDFETGKMWKRDIHLINSGTFCEPLVEGADGYMDRKNEIIPTNIGTTTLEFNAYQGKVTGHI